MGNQTFIAAQHSRVGDGTFTAVAHSDSVPSLQVPVPAVSPTRPWRPYDLTENADGTITYDNRPLPGAR